MNWFYKPVQHAYYVGNFNVFFLRKDQSPCSDYYPNNASDHQGFLMYVSQFIDFGWDSPLRTLE